MGTTLDTERTYAADYDMKGDARKIAEHGSRDAERLKKDKDSKERNADDALAATAAQTGQS
jgi:hypothetical protein